MFIYSRGILLDCGCVMCILKAGPSMGPNPVTGKGIRDGRPRSGYGLHCFLPTAVIRRRVLMRHRKTIHMDFVWILYVWAHRDMGLLRNAARGEVLHVYLDRESQHRLISCMRMKTCMKMVAVSGYASGRG